MNETGTSAHVRAEAAGDGAAGAVREAVARAARLEAEAEFPRRYVDHVRAATGWLGVAPSGAGDVRSAALFLDRQAAIDLEPPMGARGRGRRLVKLGVRRLLGWYVRFLGQQVAALGQGAARLGFATAGRLEALEADRAALEEEVAALRERVARLEAAAGGAGAPDRPR